MRKVIKIIVISFIISVISSNRIQAFGNDIYSPVKSNFFPIDGSKVLDYLLDISFNTNENAICRLSLSDEGYDEMGDNVSCNGASTTDHSCSTPDLGIFGTKEIYIACTDEIGNKDTEENNTKLTYTYEMTSEPKFSWAKRLGGTDYDSGESITTDSSNNTIVTGYVKGNVDLNGDGDSTDGGAEDSTGYGSYDAFVSVFNSSGVHLWAKRIGGINSDSGKSVTTDSSNNIIVIGNIIGNADLNGDGDSTDGGAEDSTGYGARDIFISVFNSSGVHQWAKRLGGANVGWADSGDSVTTDSSNNIIVTGYVGSVQTNADLNGDGDSTDGGAEVGTNSTYDSFISVFNSSGVHLWAKRIGPANGLSVSIDSSDNIIITGIVWSNTDLNGDGDSTDGGAEDGTGYGSYDAFVSVFNSSGVHLWAKRLGGTKLDVSNSVTSDSSNNIIVTGYVESNADLNGDRDSTDGGAEDSTGYGGYDAFVSVFNSSGVHQWAKRFGGTNYDQGYSVTTDSSKNIIVTGYVEGNVDLNGDGDFTDGETEDSMSVDDDIFLSSFNSSGVHLWAKRFGGTNNDSGYSVTTDSSNNIIFTGLVDGNVDLNGDGASTDGGAEDSTGYGWDDIVLSVFSLDRVIPTGEISINSNIPDTLDPNVSLSLLATDTESEIRQMIVCNNPSFTDCNWEIYNTTKSWTLAEGLGIKTVYVKYMDGSGNISQTYSDTITLTSTTKESISLSVKISQIGKITKIEDKTPLSIYFTSQKPVIKGITQSGNIVYFVIGENVYNTVANSNGEYTITLNVDKGKNTIQYYSKDNSGNTSDTKTLILTVGVENFPLYLLERLGLIKPNPNSPAGNIETPQQDEQQPIIEEENIKPQEPKLVINFQTIQFVNKEGNPMEGALVEIDGQEYFTDSKGEIRVVELEDGKNYKVKIEYEGIKYETEVLGEKETEGSVKISITEGDISKGIDIKKIGIYGGIALLFILFLILILKKRKKEEETYT